MCGSPGYSQSPPCGMFLLLSSLYLILSRLQRFDFPLDPEHKSFHTEALLSLSKASGLYPDCLTLKGVEMEKLPVKRGSYGEIHKGQWQGKLIAVKVMKMYQISNVPKLLKVGFDYWRFLDLK